MSRDILLFGGGDSEHQAALLQWAERTPGLHSFMPDFHRLQLEHWIWMHRAHLTGRVLDIGVENPRRWIGAGYRTLNERGGDVTGTLLALPFADGTFDALVLTEVLEHCVDPSLAMTEVWRVLKPGGLVLVTSPFIWPEHGREGEYRDYWRFTRHGWERLLDAFVGRQITPCAWTTEGAQCYDLMRRFECQGLRALTQATTGYLCSARKGES